MKEPDDFDPLLGVRRSEFSNLSVEGVLDEYDYQKLTEYFDLSRPS